MVQPIKLRNMKSFSQAWQPKQRVWFQKNDDRKLGVKRETFSDSDWKEFKEHQRELKQEAKIRKSMREGMRKSDNY